MKEKILLLLFLASAFFSNAQNVGINTTSPQASLDVKGTERVGGINNYVKYDSATGKIEWVGASLFTPVSQQIIKHSASNEGLYAGGGKLEYRNSTSTPVFFSDWTTGNGYFSGNLGIGTVSPTAKFQIRDGASGITPFFSARVVVETNSHTYVNLLAPDPFETGILFGSGTTAVSGLISYNSTTVPKGFIFNNNGNLTRMVINSAGNVGIGVTDPQQTLSLKGGMNIDQTNLNHGTIDNNILRFGSSSGEAIGSARGSGDNLYGLDFYGGGLKRMVITNGGNVGIGTSTPQYPLDINGRMRLNGTNPNDPGIWLNDAGTDKAFIGLQNDNTHVGFYGNSSLGWGFTMNMGTGALALNGNEGQTGQVLQSNGNSSAPVWQALGNILQTYYNNNTQESPLFPNTGNETFIFNNHTYSFSVSQNSRLIISLNAIITSLSCFNCGYSADLIKIKLDGNYIYDPVYDNSDTNNGQRSQFTISNFMYDIGPGSHMIQFEALHYFSGTTTIIDLNSTSMIVLPR